MPLKIAAFESGETEQYKYIEFSDPISDWRCQIQLQFRPNGEFCGLNMGGIFKENYVIKEFPITSDPVKETQCQYQSQISNQTPDSSECLPAEVQAEKLPSL